MTWARLDDGFPLHRKARKAGPVGLALAVAGICYCSRYLTDGRIPKHELPDCWPWPTIDLAETAALLCEIGIWHDRGDHYEVHDYLDYNPTREYVIAERAKKIAAGKAGGKASAKARGQAPAQAPAAASASGASEPHPTPTPTPVPDQKKETRASPTPTPELWTDPDLRYIAVQRIWSDTCRRAGRPWHDMPTGADRTALATIAAHAAAASAAAPGDVARRALEAFSGDASQEPYGHALSWCAQHVAVYATGRTPPRKGEAPREDPTVERLRAQLRDLGTMDAAKSAVIREQLRKAQGA